MKPTDPDYLRTLTHLDPSDKKQNKATAPYPGICTRCNTPFKNHNEYKLHIKNKQCDGLAIFTSDPNPEEAIQIFEPLKI